MEIKESIEITAAARALEAYPAHEGASNEWIKMHISSGDCAAFIKGFAAALREMLSEAIPATVTTTNPKQIYARSDDWDRMLGQCENAERVKILIIREKAQEIPRDGQE